MEVSQAIPSEIGSPATSLPIENTNGKTQVRRICFILFPQGDHRKSILHLCRHQVLWDWHHRIISHQLKEWCTLCPACPKQLIRAPRLLELLLETFQPLGWGWSAFHQFDRMELQHLGFEVIHQKLQWLSHESEISVRFFSDPGGTQP